MNNNLSQTTTPVKSGDKTTDARMHENMREMLEQNIAISEEIKKNTKYIKRYIIFSQIFSVIKILIILVPITWIVLYAPRVINDIKKDPNILFNNSIFSGLVNSITGAVSSEVNKNIPINTKNIPPEVQKYLK
ncbi:hypothetical protein A2331_06875 [Candidatus Falkowbacteria bacterium RIFOXYB2_FULL_34_18]|uniref:Uncharacterized protein n=1 Tax=Candidatus Falkowbacteria bacterium RIFOXYD2_FULL_34_120 TaxID=1798007 RepID=A0A1F5TRE8_9BACT|nr:MAG: hypothetical protein A2331_06875 [Candidatus Falkowbacteria bacterium RIFOXYB2_FULL_34_18]OGF29955.1 MAG: hypothetical protein A2500_03800 [Candidatus Falkowbacteria bacterium RIFOXYC12_FULL_34_55]OGF37187.1 MAG: hypothetical protein A2466_02715 [Candidatus Falkowbacteria bacterium RIFOXYC2_FULL_34_220]OGF39493.1 MAG: hypothetical protein A2515_04175 [Candidatus Falkowbacteria bacterium RIFOXYD12_FULL_34_57]OGF41525.1 MAG: hypothetical protein A2531_02430 [Candidatus Falkowbacteria bact